MQLVPVFCPATVVVQPVGMTVEQPAQSVVLVPKFGLRSP